MPSYVGEDWQPTESAPLGLMPFIAKLEMKRRKLPDDLILPTAAREPRIRSAPPIPGDPIMFNQ
jgi:hypothetical protein